ncbi:co-chaperone HscB [Serratia microhaemolytica]|uniref:co-chaperone HscB n=1 Tax=Serratia microhaemolytica TaxID=2675110 RepID=UPI000FDF124F|nr:co-chaperone HscB [Serratia microhaemolytica]
MNYFTLFALPQCYQLDISNMTLRYQELQRQYHPDRVASQPERQRLIALQQAATINEAYQTLKHPLRRAEYLLLLQGIDIRNEQQTLRDSAFLMQQLELREELDTIEHQAIRNSADALQALATFTARVEKLLLSYRQQMVTQLDQQQWSQAADSVRKLRFLDKLQQQQEQLEEKLLGFT